MSKAVRPGRAASLAEKTILGVIAGGAGAIALVDIVLLISRTITLMAADDVVVPRMALEQDAAESIAAAPGVVDAAFDSVTITAEGLSASPRALLAGADALGSIGVIGLCVVVALICVRLFIGRPFSAAVTWGIGTAAILVMAGGLLSQAVRAGAHTEITSELGLTAVGLPSFEMTIDLAPIGWGLALAVIAGAFEIGQRMQRETEGLV